MHQNHLSGLLKLRVLGPTRRVSDQVCPGETQELASLSSQIMLMLPVQGSWFEIPALNHILTSCERIKSELFLWSVLLLTFPISLPSTPPISLHSSHSSHLLVSQLYRACSASRLLQVPFHFPGMLCPQMFVGIIPCIHLGVFYTFRYLFKCDIFRRAFPDHPI